MEAAEAKKNKKAIQQSLPRGVNLEQTSTYTYNDRGQLLPVNAVNYGKLPKLEGQNLKINKIESLQAIQRPSTRGSSITVSKRASQKPPKGPLSGMSNN